jgi:hypothetical protein
MTMVSEFFFLQIKTKNFLPKSIIHIILVPTKIKVKIVQLVKCHRGPN